MEKKVYEGFKRTSLNTNDITENSTVEKTSSTVKKTSASTKTPKEPKRTTTARMAGRSALSKPRLAMFIDVDNAGISRENLLEILFYANGKFQIELCKLYGFNEETLPGIRDFASEYNVTTVGKMMFKQPGVNCLDSRLLLDAYECALNNKNKIDLIFVWCYPCDLEELFEKIVNLGVNTATIDNSIFDCKNKFVSQTFKLYSPYNFTVEQRTYGKVKNESSNIVPNNIEIALAPEVSEVSTTTADMSTSTVQTPTLPAESETPAPINTTKPSIFDENVVPPVLPRRQIVERSNSNRPSMPATTESNTETSAEMIDIETDSSQPTSLVEEIARKLNIDINTNEDESNQPSLASELFMNMLKQVGFDNDTSRPLKYEDTIGDL